MRYNQLIYKNLYRAIRMWANGFVVLLSDGKSFYNSYLQMSYYKVGLDIGSTTAKMVVLDEQNSTVFQRYERHQAKVNECLRLFFGQLNEQLPADAQISLCITGSVGMGVAEKCGLPFVQEVVAAANYVRQNHPEVVSMIDIGGEDAKVVFFEKGQAIDLRMNGNCAGGTGAFIDQMAILLGVPVNELSELALGAKQVHPIASRCGVFCKTDIQNLIAKNIPKEDIAASIFHAVAVQTVVTLAHGCEITAPVLFCGGPLTFIPALRKAFANYLHLNADGHDIVLPEQAHLIPAWGTALAEQHKSACNMGVMAVLSMLEERLNANLRPYTSLPTIFDSTEEYVQWQTRIARGNYKRRQLPTGKLRVTLGIDSGSTTTKIVILDEEQHIRFSFYRNNNGNPIQAVEDGLTRLMAECEHHGTELEIVGSCSTGYGEDLIKAAFGLNTGIIETIAHYMAAKHIDPEVSFILDIGGQDMKAIFVQHGVINRIEINEACSSGCGSFIGTFAQSLNYSVADFAQAACLSKAPCDLGTRCTVFMNSKVKQVLREGAQVADIAAGLLYSVVKNCLYKVLQLKNPDELGEHIVVQGGTMRNDAIVRGFEKLVGKDISRSDCPELMGALGCALYAQEGAAAYGTPLSELLKRATYTSKLLQCKGCDNQCAVTRYTFSGDSQYYSGNRCEKVFSNQGRAQNRGSNTYERKLELLFDRQADIEKPLMTIGIARGLNMFEEYPFWHTLLTNCNIAVKLSEPSSFARYEKAAHMVMSDNICFPAKLMHGHVQNLIEHGVDRIFMPFVVFENNNASDGPQQNTYNCPVVAGYSQVVKSVQSGTTPIDAPVISFKDSKLLYKQCSDYLKGLGVGERTIRNAFKLALAAQNEFETELALCNQQAFDKARSNGDLVVLLAGRPYHADPLIQHKISHMIADLGVHVITDDIVRQQGLTLSGVSYLPQWAFTNRILKAAQWAAEQPQTVQFMELTSFGCGPDAFLVDEVRALLKRYDKNLTLLKIDDISNVGSIKLRARSLVESLRVSPQVLAARKVRPFVTTPPYTKADRHKTLIAPFFTPFVSPLIPSVFRLAGYNLVNLPMSNETSCQWGLQYSNNEVCYPATLVVGDIVNAFKSGKFDPNNTAVAMTQTGGQCRASSYMSLIKRALIDAGYTQTPVVSLAPGSGIDNNQPGFQVPWLKILPAVLAGLLFSDCIAKLYYASVVRESIPGKADELRDTYLQLAAKIISQNSTTAMMTLLHRAIKDFDAICVDKKDCPRVGVVGEIYLKFNPFAQKDITAWMVEQGIEVVPPMLLDFFAQSFVNREARINERIQRSSMPRFIMDWIYALVQRQIDRVNRMGKDFRYFTPFESIYEKAELAKPIITLNAQFGEGWLIAGELASFAHQGVNHVVSLQPFGCIANHIVEKGIEKRVKAMYPQMNILSLDFDSSVSEVNITNRMLLFVDSLMSPQKA